MGTTSSRGLRSTRLIGLIAICVAALAVAADAQTLPAIYKIQGVVSDAIGRPLAGVTVSDGRTTTTTSASGYYELGQQAVGGHPLEFRRLDLAPETPTVDVTLPLDTTHNQTMFYAISSAVQQAAVSTAAGPTTNTVTVLSRAPDPGGATPTAGQACVAVSAQPGSVARAGYVSTTTDQGYPLSTYTAVVPLEAAESEGTKSFTLWAHECASSSTKLSKDVGASFLIDNTAPDIQNVLPGTNGNTIHADPTLGARIADSGSGVLPSSIVYRLTDESTGITTVLPGSGVYDPSSTWSSFPTGGTGVVIQQDRTYRLSVAAADHAGNTAIVSSAPDAASGFRRVFVSVGQAQASIPPTQCTVVQPATTRSNAGALPRAKCTNVVVHLTDAQISMSSAQGSGTAAGRYPVPLTTAMLRVEVGDSGDISLPAYSPTDAAWNNRFVTTYFHVPAPSSTALNVPLPQSDRLLGTLETDVPVGTTAASLSMDSVVVSGAHDTCRDPVAQPGCSQDVIVAPGRDLGGFSALPAHSQSCDAALALTPRFRLAPGGATTIDVTVDNTTLAVSSVQLRYSVDGGAPVTVTVPGTGATSYSLPLPALAAGSVVRYVAMANGSFNSSECSGAQAAVAPSNHAHVAVVAAAGDESDTIERAALDAIAIIGRQPKPLPGDITAGCAARFDPANSPCSALSAVPWRPETAWTGAAAAVTLGSTWATPTTSPGCTISPDGKTLELQGANGAWWRTPATLGAGSPNGANRSTWSRVNGALAWNASLRGSFLAGHGTAAGTGQAGYAVAISGPPGSTFTGRAELDWSSSVQARVRLQHGLVRDGGAAGGLASARASFTSGIDDLNGDGDLGGAGIGLVSAETSAPPGVAVPADRALLDSRDSTATFDLTVGAGKTLAVYAQLHASLHARWDGRATAEVTTTAPWTLEAEALRLVLDPSAGYWTGC